MERYEYKVVPAPEKGLKAKGIKHPADRFAHALETAMNQLGADGWEYWRAESLPATERSGFTGSKITERHLLVFRRLIVEPVRPARALAPEPQPEPVPEPVPAPAPEPENAPVFTRRLEIAREQRQAALEGDGEATEIPRLRPVQDD